MVLPFGETPTPISETGDCTLEDFEDYLCSGPESVLEGGGIAPE
jgi:hypothetical protein